MLKTHHDVSFFLKDSYVSVSWLKLGRKGCMDGKSIQKLMVLFGKRSAALLKFSSPLNHAECRILCFICGIYCQQNILNFIVPLQIVILTK